MYDKGSRYYRKIDVKVWGVNEEEVYTRIRVSSTTNSVKQMQARITDIVSHSTNILSENIYIDVNEKIGASWRNSDFFVRLNGPADGEGAAGVTKIRPFDFKQE